MHNDYNCNKILFDIFSKFILTELKNLSFIRTARYKSYLEK